MAAHGDADLKARVRAAMDLNEKAADLIDEERYDEALAVCDEVAARFGKAHEPRLLGKVVWALNYKQRAFSRAGRRDEASQTFASLLDRSADNDAPEVTVAVMWARYHRAWALSERDGNSVDAAQVLADLICPFESVDPPPGGDPVLSTALLLGAKIARDGGDNTAAIMFHDALLERYADSTDPLVRADVAKALLEKAWTLGLIGDVAQAMEVYDTFIERFGEPQDLGERQRLAEVLNARGYWLRGDGNLQAALTAHRAVLERFDEHESRSLAEQVAYARRWVARLTAERR